jgi:hypothetical protein
VLSNFEPKPVEGISREWLNRADVSQPVALVKHLCSTGVITPSGGGGLFTMDDVSLGIGGLSPSFLMSLENEFRSPATSILNRYV